MAPRFNIACRNHKADRVLPRFSRYLSDGLGWRLTAAPDASASGVFLSAYFEGALLKPWPAGLPTVAYFTHREEDPPNNPKARFYDDMARRVTVRLATCALYAEGLGGYGPTIQARAPVERDRFVLGPALSDRKLMAGFSGYTYRNNRKGEDLAAGLVDSKAGRAVEWRASGRGWPVPTAGYKWADMPSFYQSLDVLIVTSRVEGVPMPPLEALSCGVSIVIPRGVGLLDELPSAPGIHRYDRGDLDGLRSALTEAIEARRSVDREALRACTEDYTIANWCADVAEAMDIAMEWAEGAELDAGINERSGEAGALPVIEVCDPVDRGTGSDRGIYCVAFGDPARKCAEALIKSAKEHMPSVPICLVSDRKLGREDVFIKHGDLDVGGRRAKLRAYELAPAEWRAVLYLDADTEIQHADVGYLFDLIFDGWEFVITKDPHLMDTMHAFRRRNNAAEVAETEDRIFTLHTLQYNGGVWAFGRNDRIAAFFARWRAEWERHAQRDQAALLRAMYADPLRVFVLGNEWNTFPKYTRGIETAGLVHFPGRARRWAGLLPGRIDSAEAWRQVDRYMRRRSAAPVSGRSRRRGGGA